MPKWLGLVILLAGLSIACQVESHDRYLRQPGFDVLHYSLALRLSDSSDTIYGRATLSLLVRNLSDSLLRLDMSNMTVSRVEAGQSPLDYEYTNNNITLALPPGTRPGDTLQLAVDYYGKPADGLIIANNKFGRRTIFADNWPDRARFWFPGIDHPSDKATVEFNLTLPRHYTVVANGKLVEVVDHNEATRTWRWIEPVPIPTYCMVFGAADFVTTSLSNDANVEVTGYLFAEDAPYARENFGRVAEMMSFFTTKLGDFPYEKLALVQSATRFGGMENASAIFFPEKSFGEDRDLEGVTAHEIVHQWFGDSVTESDWPHLWLSEGFATYGAALFYEAVDGADKFRAQMRAHRDRYFKYARLHPGPVVDTTITNAMRLLNPNNYSKAAWVLHMLRHQVGEEKFWQGVRTFYRDFKNGNAESEDFEKVMESVTGDSLDWFFDQWLYQPGYPRLEVQWWWQAPDSVVQVAIAQKQPDGTYQLPLEVALHIAGSQERRSLWVKTRESIARLPSAGRPDHIEIDPDEKLLLQATVSERPVRQSNLNQGR